MTAAATSSSFIGEPPSQFMHYVRDEPCRPAATANAINVKILMASITGLPQRFPCRALHRPPRPSLSHIFASTWRGVYHAVDPESFSMARASARRSSNPRKQKENSLLNGNVHPLTVSVPARVAVPWGGMENGMAGAVHAMPRRPPLRKTFKSFGSWGLRRNCRARTKRRSQV